MNNSIPDSAKKPLQEIVDGYLRILGENLVGIYVHGSVAMNCFSPNISDIDFLVVVKEDINIKQKRQIIQLLINLSDRYPIKKGLEMSIVLEKYTKNFVYPTPFILHYSKCWKEKYRNGEIDFKTTEGKDPDLAAHFTVTKARGICIYGKSIDEVFGEVPKEDYIASLMYDLEDVEYNIIQEPIYTGLNLCRILQYLEEGKISSKLEGGRWALRNLPDIYKEIVEKLTKMYKGDRVIYDLDKKDLKEFVKYMIGKIKNKTQP